MKIDMEFYIFTVLSTLFYSCNTAIMKKKVIQQIFSQ